jgi:hypothetical protein
MPTDTDIQKNHKKLMQGIASKSILCSNNKEKITNLKNFLGELDRRRGTSWQHTFPWLEQIKD